MHVRPPPPTPATSHDPSHPMPALDRITPPSPPQVRPDVRGRSLRHPHIELLPFPMRDRMPADVPQATAAAAAAAATITAAAAFK